MSSKTQRLSEILILFLSKSFLAFLSTFWQECDLDSTTVLPVPIGQSCNSVQSFIAMTHSATSHVIQEGLMSTSKDTDRLQCLYSPSRITCSGC